MSTVHLDFFTCTRIRPIRVPCGHKKVCGLLPEAAGRAPHHQKSGGSDHHVRRVVPPSSPPVLVRRPDSVHGGEIQFPPCCRRARPRPPNHACKPPCCWPRRRRVCRLQWVRVNADSCNRSLRVRNVRLGAGVLARPRWRPLRGRSMRMNRRRWRSHRRSRPRPRRRRWWRPLGRTRCSHRVWPRAATPGMTGTAGTA